MEQGSYLGQLDERMEGIFSDLKTLLSHNDDPEQPEMELKGQEECTYGTVVGFGGQVLQIVPSEVH